MRPTLRTTRAFVFDADGVVIESRGFANRLDREYDISTEVTRPFFTGPFQSCLEGKTDLRESLKPFLEQWGWPLSVGDFVDQWMEYDDQPRQDILRIVEGFRNRGIPCYLASNQEPTRAEYIRNVMGFQDYFDELFFSCDLGVLKPNHAFFSSVQGRISMEPRSIWFWDDALRYVRGARAAGWNAVLYESVESITNVI